LDESNFDLPASKLALRVVAETGVWTLSIGRQPAETAGIYLQYHEELCRSVIKKFDVGYTEAEDVVQTAFIRYTESSAPVLNPRAFLYKVCSNIAIDQIRRRDVQNGYARSVAAIESESAEEIGPERQLEARQRLGIISRALWAMPGKRRRLLMMNRFDGLSYAEIARRVNLSETVVRKHIAKALAGCQCALQNEDK
jgi:RNA polymerase sigma factor (sigma-70 family)